MCSIRSGMFIWKENIKPLAGLIFIQIVSFQFSCLQGDFNLSNKTSPEIAP